MKAPAPACLLAIYFFVPLAQLRSLPLDSARVYERNGSFLRDSVLNWKTLQGLLDNLSFVFR